MRAQSIPAAPGTTGGVSNAGHTATTLVLAWGALAFGAVYEWAFWPLAVACVLCGAHALLRRTHVARLPSVLTGVCLAAVAVATLTQLVPLPRNLLTALSPRAETVLSELDILFAVRAVDRHALSIAPRATMTALVLYGAFVAMMLGVARVVSVTGPRRLAGLIAGLGVVLALVGIIQRPFYSGRIYGFWTPMAAGSPFGPFVNQNHFAGWMLMALPLTFGLLCANAARVTPQVATDWRHRVLWWSSPEANRVLLLAAAAAVMALSLMLTMSRSGMLALAVSISITIWWAIRRLPAGSGRWVVTGYFACLVLSVVGWTGVDAVAGRFGTANPATLNERLPIWRDTWRIVTDFWLTGSGLNTYGVATLFYQTSHPGLHLREAHNDYLQLAAEGGLLLGVPIVCTVAALVRDIRRRFVGSSGSSYWIRLGAVTGLAAIALQSTVEFSLQMPGNAAFCAVLCGIALHRDPRSRTGTSDVAPSRSAGDERPRVISASRTDRVACRDDRRGADRDCGGAQRRQNADLRKPERNDIGGARHLDRLRGPRQRHARRAKDFVRRHAFQGVGAALDARHGEFAVLGRDRLGEHGAGRIDELHRDFGEGPPDLGGHGARNHARALTNSAGENPGILALWRSLARGGALSLRLESSQRGAHQRVDQRKRQHALHVDSPDPGRLVSSAPHVARL